MGRLIDDLLAFSRLGRKAMNFSEIDMAALVREVFEELKVVYPDRDIVLEVDSLPPGWCDPAMMRQVLANLLSNALKFTARQIKTVIQVGGANDKDEVIYFVKDNGVGFDAQYADKLFGVFQRLHGADEFEGSGVGLAIVQRIIHRHGGRVWAESVLGEGAVFYFTLPFNAAPGMDVLK
jgi:light-regulated signal transduction histidine kinase (bacteriophytochrome)